MFDILLHEYVSNKLPSNILNADTLVTVKKTKLELQLYW